METLPGTTMYSSFPLSLVVLAPIPPLVFVPTYLDSFILTFVLVPIPINLWPCYRLC